VIIQYINLMSSSESPKTMIGGDQMIFRYTILYVAAALDFFERASGFRRLLLYEAGGYRELDTASTKLAFSTCKLISELGKSLVAANPAAPVEHSFCGDAEIRRIQSTSL
jgi:hypothetical protein